MTRSTGRKVTARMRCGLLNSIMLRAVTLAGIAATPLMLPGTAQADTWQGMTGVYNADINWSGGVVPERGAASFINNGSIRAVSVSGDTSLALLEFGSGGLGYTLSTDAGVRFDIADITNSNLAAEHSLWPTASVVSSLQARLPGEWPLRRISGPFTSTVRAARRCVRGLSASAGS